MSIRRPSQRLVRRTSQLIATVAIGAMAIGSAGAADLPVFIPAPIVIPPPAPQPGFYASVALLYMTRSDPAQAPILNEADPVPAAAEPLPGAPVGDPFDAQDFDFGWTFGVEARAGVILPSGNFGFEAGGFWLRPWVAYYADDDIGRPDLATDPPLAVWDMLSFEAWNTTRIYGLDANAVAHLGPLQIYGGVAYIHLRDAMEIVAPMSQLPTEYYNWWTGNRMIGPQVGARFTIGNASPFSVEVGGRVGILRNSMSNEVFLDMAADVAATDFDTVWTLMAGGGVTAKFNVNESLAITAGYQALWLQKVALAPHQVGATDPITPELDTFYAPILIHGVSAGLAFRF